MGGPRETIGQGRGWSGWHFGKLAREIKEVGGTIPLAWSQHFKQGRADKMERWYGPLPLDEGRWLVLGAHSHVFQISKCSNNL